MSAEALPEKDPTALLRGLTERLYRKHGAHLIVWLRKRFGDGPPEPEDCAQAAFAKISGMDSFDHVEDQRAFLYTVAANIAVSGIRSQRRATRLIEENVSHTDIIFENLTPERVLLGKDNFKQLKKALSQLTDRQREIVERSRLKGQTYAQISQETGWSLGTISAELRTAMLVLAKIHDPSGGDE
ncbi:RNA polymerase sigma factor [Ponticaulis profundi]|uniref:RNA polymerase sigma factor n=1 Tax=Ponticaulis profundi TaxID=2665222 RepID=A0ABW1SA04_9PROT